MNFTIISSQRILNKINNFIMDEITQENAKISPNLIIIKEEIDIKEENVCEEMLPFLQDNEIFTTGNENGEVNSIYSSPHNLNESKIKLEGVEDLGNCITTIKTEKAIFKCEMCNYTSSKKANLRRHIYRHNDGSLKCVNGLQTSDPDPTDEFDQIMFKCDKCTYITFKKDNYRKHKYWHKKKAEQTCVSDESENKSDSLQEDMVILITDEGTELFKCTRCGYTSTKKDSVRRHVYRHKKGKLLKCVQCEYQCTEQCDMIRHIRLHTGETPFVCEICGRGYRRKDSLVSHLRTHSKERVFQCTTCDYRSVHKSTLQQHMYLHTGEKPFKCDVCDYRCAHKRYLVGHRRLHLDEKPFQCTLCSYQCVRSRRLKEHIMRMHADEKPSQ